MPTTEPKIRARGTVRVSLPAKIAYSPDALKKSIGDIMERLGCGKCFSGADCHFTAERNFVFENGVSLKASELNPQPLPPRSTTAYVSLASGARYNIDKVFKAIDATIINIGPCPCHSGWDVFFLNESKVIGINENLEAMQFGG